MGIEGGVEMIKMNEMAIDNDEILLTRELIWAVYKIYGRTQANMQSQLLIMGGFETYTVSSTFTDNSIYISR